MPKLKNRLFSLWLQDAENRYQKAKYRFLTKVQNNISRKIRCALERSVRVIVFIGRILKYEVLRIFPFTSEAKRMGIIVREQETSQILFLLKGAETVMQQKIDPVFWLQEEVSNIVLDYKVCFFSCSEYAFMSSGSEYAVMSSDISRCDMGPT